MIFVTVGTHEQPFNRLVEYMDNWAKEHKETVIIQIGFSTYVPLNCKWQRLFSYEEMQKYVNEARIVITHGGPSSFIAPLQIGKVPIVVPRKKEFGEHVNNHQVDFAKKIESRLDNIFLIDNIEELSETIENYDKLMSKKKRKNISNNATFCNNFTRIVNEMFQE